MIPPKNPVKSKSFLSLFLTLYSLYALLLVQDYFSFCGDIKSVTISSSEDGRSREAEIQFESSAAASTAVLLNNALVEGRNISVALVDNGGASESTFSSNETNDFKAKNDSSASVDSKGSNVLSEITSQAKTVASQVSSATKDLNNKYDITGKLKGAYDSAAMTTSATFEKLDAQYDLKGKTGKAVEATKTGISSMYRQISGFWSTSSAEGSTAKSPRNANNSPSPSTEKQ